MIVVQAGNHPDGASFGTQAAIANGKLLHQE